MPLNKKIISTFILLIISTSFFSGCILEEIFGAATFSVNSWSVDDYDGFPCINIYFKCKGRVNLEMLDPNQEKVDNDFFYSDGNTSLNLGNYRENIDSGKYYLKAYDKNDKEIFSKDFSFSNSDLSILSCEQRWWGNSAGYSLIGLELKVKNSGDLPVYPYTISIVTDSKEVSSLILPTVVLPGTVTEIYSYVYHEGQFEEDSFIVNIEDENKMSFCSDTFSFKEINTVSTTIFKENDLDNSLIIPFPDFLYNYYIGLERKTIEDYILFVFDKYDDSFLEMVLEKIISTVEYGEFRYNQMTDEEKINYIADFVQSLDYKKDSEVDDSYEYPRYPIETIFNGEGGGDCEDKSILTASLLKIAGFNVSLIRLPDHMAVGVNLSDKKISEYEYFVDNYYFLETTTKGKPCGFIPNDYRSLSDEAVVYKIDARPLLYHDWKDGVVTIFSKTEIGSFVKSIVFVENFGNSIASDVKIEGVFYTDSGLEFQPEKVTIDEIKSGEKEKIILSVQKPTGINTWFKTRIIYEGNVVDTKESKSYFD